MAADADVDEEGRIIILVHSTCGIIMTLHYSDASNEMTQWNDTVDKICLLVFGIDGKFALSLESCL